MSGEKKGFYLVKVEELNVFSNTGLPVEVCDLDSRRVGAIEVSVQIRYPGEVEMETKRTTFRK